MIKKKKINNSELLNSIKYFHIADILLLIKPQITFFTYKYFNNSSYYVVKVRNSKNFIDI